jgi:uncharacterized membrane protein YfcA
MSAEPKVVAASTMKMAPGHPEHPAQCAISTVLSIVVLRGLVPAIAPWLLLRLAFGNLVGLPLGLVAFRYADSTLVRAAAGAMILGFAILMAVSRRRQGEPGKHWTAFAMSPGLDVAAGAVSGIASALVGQPGPPVLISSDPYRSMATASARQPTGSR